MVRAMFGVPHKDKGIDKDLMWLEGNHRSAHYGAQCSLVWSCDDEGKWSLEGH